MARTAAMLADQRRELPDQPGVYLFLDGAGGVLYVGKAKSIRKRVASHFARPGGPAREMVGRAIGTGSDGEDAGAAAGDVD